MAPRKQRSTTSNLVAVVCAVSVGGAAGCALEELDGVDEHRSEVSEQQRDIPIRWVHGLRAKEKIEGGYLRTNATKNGATMQVHTQGLEPNGTYTLWFVFFNHPEYCTDPPAYSEGVLRCGIADLFNDKADGSFVYGDGLVASGDWDHFSGYRPVDEYPDGFEQIAWGSGILTNPLGAEYQATLRYHGPKDPDYMPDQIETLNGGCREGEPYHPCSDDQAVGARHDLPVGCEEFSDLDDLEKCFYTGL